MGCISHEYCLKMRDCLFHQGWSKEYSIHKYVGDFDWPESPAMERFGLHNYECFSFIRWKSFHFCILILPTQDFVGNDNLVQILHCHFTQSEWQFSEMPSLLQVFFDKVNIGNILVHVTKNQFACLCPRTLNDCLRETVWLTIRLKNLVKNIKLIGVRGNPQ